MKLKLFPKNEQELSKLFVLIFPLTLVLSLTISFFKNAYFTFANLLPNNVIFNYGFLDRLDTQASFGLVFGAALCMSFSYLFSKSLGRAMFLFPLVFLTLLGVVGTEFLDILVNFFFQNTAYDLGNSSLLILLKILVVFGLFSLASLNLLAKKEASIFASAQFLYGAVVFYLISLFIVRAELRVYSDIFLINSLYTGTHIYVGFAFIYMAIVHFLMTRPLGAILFNKTLASVTFWGFLFLLPWTNSKYYYGSVLPNWIENISIYLSMSLVIPLLAFLVNYIKTIQSREENQPISPNLLNFSVILFSITTIFHMVSGFENLLPILGITNFVNAINYGFSGSLILATISLSYYLIPKLFGREVAYSKLEGIVFLGFKISYISILINNIVLGINSGYSWNAGANAGNPTIYGEGFEIVWNQISFNFSLNTFISLLLLGSGFMYLVSVLRAISSGSITTVEEMVYTNE